MQLQHNQSNTADPMARESDRTEAPMGFAVLFLISQVLFEFVFKRGFLSDAHGCSQLTDAVTVLHTLVVTCSDLFSIFGHFCPSGIAVLCHGTFLLQCPYQRCSLASR